MPVRHKPSAFHGELAKLAAYDRAKARRFSQLQDALEAIGHQALIIKKAAEDKEIIAAATTINARVEAVRGLFINPTTKGVSDE